MGRVEEGISRINIHLVPHRHQQKTQGIFNIGKWGESRVDALRSDWEGRRGVQGKAM